MASFSHNSDYQHTNTDMLYWLRFIHYDNGKLASYKMYIYVVFTYSYGLYVYPVKFSSADNVQ